LWRESLYLLGRKMDHLEMRVVVDQDLKLAPFVIGGRLGRV
jgi:hypothetical protein